MAGLSDVSIKLGDDGIVADALTNFGASVFTILSEAV